MQARRCIRKEGHGGNGSRELGSGNLGTNPEPACPIPPQERYILTFNENSTRMRLIKLEGNLNPLLFNRMGIDFIVIDSIDGGLSILSIKALNANAVGSKLGLRHFYLIRGRYRYFIHQRSS